jgi:hypothetical protein
MIVQNHGRRKGRTVGGTAHHEQRVVVDDRLVGELVETVGIVNSENCRLHTEGVAGLCPLINGKKHWRWPDGLGRSATAGHGGLRHRGADADELLDIL